MSDPREIVLVAALGRNRVIGAGGRMPWHLPADLKRFKAVTMGHPVVMGRRTFESIGRALPGRRSIVVSRTLERVPAGCELAGSLDEALEKAGRDTAMLIGGGELYRAALSRATRMELTFVDARPEGDAYFPAWNHADWDVVAMSARPADADNEYRLVFCTLVRASHAAAAGAG